MKSKNYPAIFLGAIFSLALTHGLMTGNALAHSPNGGKGGGSSLAKIQILDIFVPGAEGSPSLYNLIDNNARTRWKTGRASDRFVLDLGLAQRVSQIQMALDKHRKSGQHRYSVHISQDGMNWLPVIKNRRFNSGRFVKAGFNPINARYLRISLNRISHKDVLSIREVMVFGRGGGQSGGGPQGQKLTLQWAPSPGHVTGYLVFYGPTPSMASTQISDVSLSEPGFNAQAPSMQFDTWRDLNARPGDNVCFRVRSYGATGLSAWSSAVCSGV